MTTSEENSSIMRPSIVHFGCGHLGVGAVLPFLIDRFGFSHRIIAVQRRSDKWSQIPNNIILPLRTKNGDCMPFRTLVVDFDNSTSRIYRNISKSLETESRLLLIVPDFQSCHDLMVTIKNSSNNLLISCSLGSGQPDLIQLLNVFRDWDKTFIFENTASTEWKDTFKKEMYHHILVDRICWNLEFAGVGKSPSVLCHCEANTDKDGNNNVSFLWPSDAGIPVDVDRSRPQLGENINYRGWEANSFENNDNEIEWHHLRKRALINAPHALASLFCYRLLASRKMEPSKQYLAPIQEMLRVAHPEWQVAMDHYLRLRAIEVAFKHQICSENEIDMEMLHVDYHGAYRKATNALRRFFETNDRLDRLMSPSNLSKELEKFDEHILKPIKFYEEKSGILIENWIYGRPNDADIVCLRDFLTETFLEATRLLAKLSVHMEHPND